MKKNVLFLTSSYPNGPGEGFIEPELDFLAQLHNLFLVPVYPRGVKRDSSIAKSIVYMCLPLFRVRFVLSLVVFSVLHPNKFLKLLQHSKSNSLSRIFRNIVLLPKAIYLSKLLRENRIDFIYAHWLSAPAQLALYLHLITGVQFGVTGHRWDLIDQNNFEAKFQYAKFVRLISKRSCDLLPKHILKKYKNKIYVIYMGVKIDKLRNLNVSSDEFKDGYQAKVLCIANLIPVKGHKYLIDAIQLLKNKGLSVHLDLIGIGDLENEIKAQIKNLNLENQIHLLGYVDHATVLELLSQKKHHIYCQPSLDLGGGLHEGVPVSLMEAMSYGMPCVSTNTGSITELIENNENGILVNDKDAELLMKAIEFLVLYPSERTRLGRRAFESINDKFNQEVNNTLLNSIIR